MRIDETNAEHYRWGDVCDGWHLLKTDGLSVIKERVPPGRSETRHLHLAARQDREGLLRHYEGIGYLRDLDQHAKEYAPGDGIFLVLREGEAVIGCGGMRRLGAEDAELVRLWLRRDWRKRGWGRLIFDRLMLEARASGRSSFAWIWRPTPSPERAGATKD